MSDPLCTLSNDHLTLTVSTLGAEAQSLRSADGREWLWHGDPAHWSGRAPILFPIVGRAPGDRVAVGAHEAEMRQHGLARRCEFALEHKDANSCRHVLRADDASRAVYPAEFELAITHVLDGAAWEVTAEVTNQGTESMPFGLGFHPAFYWPLPGGEGQPHEVVLADGGAPRRATVQDGLLRRALEDSPFENGRLTIRDDLFTEDALVFPNGTEALRYGPRGGPHLDFTFEGLPDMALWKPVGAPFLCVEPWHGTASYVGEGPQISERPNAITLEPGASRMFRYRVEIKG